MNGRRQFLVASVLAIQDSCFLYPSCPNCFSRLIQTSRSFACLKCGCSSAAEQVNYRYKLSVRAADRGELFVVTVFGSCLDAFFGLPASSLQRYIQDLIQVSELESSTIQNLLFQAAEHCFVGQTFIFGVKTSVNHDGQPFISKSTLQSLHTSNGHIKYLVACQISLPNLGCVGCTVLSYYKQLLESANFRNTFGASQLPESVLSAIDQPVGELSSLCSSTSTQGSVFSSRRDDFSSPWQQISFGLIPLSSEQATTTEISLAEVAQTRSSRSQGWEQKDSCAKISSCHQPSRDESRSREKTEGETSCEFSSLPVMTDLVIGSNAARMLKNTSWLALATLPDAHGFRPLQSTLEVEGKYSETKITYSPDCSEKAGNTVVCMSHNLCSPKLSSEKKKSVGTYQDDDPAIWDDLLLSESLSEFIARVENNKRLVSLRCFDVAYCSNETIDELGGKSGCLSPKLRHSCFDSSLEGATRKSAQPAQIVNSCKDLSSGCTSGLASTEERETAGTKLRSTIPAQAEQDQYSSHIRHPTSQSPFTKDLSCSLLPLGAYNLSDKSGSLQVTSVSRNRRSGAATEVALKYSRRLHIQRKSKPAYFSSGKIERQEENFSYPNEDTFRHLANQNAVQIDCQKLEFELEVHQKDKSLGECEPHLQTVQKQSRYCMLQNDSSCSGAGGYDASAELFGNAEEEPEIPAETPHRSHLARQGPALAKIDAAPERVLGELDIDFSRAQARVCVLAPDHSPQTYSQCESEPEEQDFVPVSQSTPVLRQLSKLGSLPVKLTPNLCSPIYSKCHSSRTFLKRGLLKRLSGNSLRLVQNRKAAGFPTRSAKSPLESDSEEWIPPSATKYIRPFVLSNPAGPHPEAGGLKKKHGIRKMVDKDILKNREERIDEYLSNDLKPKTLQFPPALIKSPPISSKCAKTPGVEAGFLEAAYETPARSAARLSYFGRDIDNIPEDWSPELFAERSMVSQHCDFMQKQLF
ncbi:DNA damage-induced apoptosis suppressor protein [Rhinatrema bivittatum]|uniref:DNA damage-induced apoptosis suppressor protein n=1 Tax=Rhinatrema bivittatum TaxID=194408 RepID=UPI00112D635A|nr:DNA damage-induced apoptosis suppressor protein [Rhinatrema bivittatum]XP_029458072.1 DNA damage-induced apoptosis suppressor protein [Rhinatrema bivittatum]XP_029458073.1 DNA damage-induced apoptosis suppressor protein [Rhinatrema bivittatum]